MKQLEANLEVMDTKDTSGKAEQAETIEIGADGIEDKDLFEDYDAYIAAPDITVPTKSLRKKNLWWAVKAYEKYYTTHPVKRYVPRIRPNIQLTLEEFHKKFRREGELLSCHIAHWIQLDWIGLHWIASSCLDAIRMRRGRRGFVAGWTLGSPWDGV